MEMAIGQLGQTLEKGEVKAKKGTADSGGRGESDREAARAPRRHERPQVLPPLQQYAVPAGGQGNAHPPLRLPVLRASGGCH